ncbi:uncharacterized protein EV422DRAFT_567451 [Fimicolochytrium jonesii]|uniref:uncharacterized protein n=1 Tax=Fimicolochytrium jonesii TaxID=1396493 RepID=UPI0022FE423B|nr:uncharacterized protein EV422DRAFT_567451 [Fimicolochytrium jonesii]KAI8821122.1 hypothetical protein EV422DRAFT_567451 [Fimicolochytrium jonesii]
MSTEFAAVTAERTSLAESPTEPRALNGHDGDDEDEQDNSADFRRSSRRLSFARRDAESGATDMPPLTGGSTNRILRKRKLPADDRHPDDLMTTAELDIGEGESSRYAFRQRKPVDYGGRRRNDEIDINMTETSGGRPSRNRQAVDYNEGRVFKMLLDQMDIREGHPRHSTDGGRPWGSPNNIARPRKIPMATTGGGPTYDSDDEGDMGKPMLQYARCTALLKELPEVTQGYYKDRLQTHLENNDFPASLPFTENRVTFDMIGGHEEHVKTIQEMIKIALLYPELARNADPIKGVMFYGPPGNGKTLMARAIASSCSSFQVPVSFFECQAADVHSKWFGESEKHLKKLFDQAKANEPAIIFFDEVDGMVPARSSGENATPHNSVVTSLLTLMDGLEDRGRVIVIGATNRLDTLDPALLRPGRFDRRLQFKRPNRGARQKIIDIRTQHFQLEQGLKERVASATDGYSGADLKSLCNDAYFKALRRTYPQIYTAPQKLHVDPALVKVTQRDFDQALRDVKPSGSIGDANGPPPSSRAQVLVSDMWDGVLRRLRVIHTALSRRSAGTAFSTIQPRVMVAGPPNIGQMEISSMAMGQLMEWGFRVQIIQNVLDSESITSAIYALRDEALPCIVLQNFDSWSAESITFLHDQLRIASHSILVFATWESTSEISDQIKEFMNGTEDDINALFGFRAIFEMSVPTEEKRAFFFEPLLESIATLPDSAQTAIPPTALAILPLAEGPPLPVLTNIQKKNMEAKCWNVLQDLKQRLRLFHKDIGKTKYRVFCHPVDESRYSDYREVVTEPMDMGEMMTKLDADQYETPEDWLKDIEQIWKNASEYNYPRSEIVHKAHELRDDAHAFVQSIPSTYRLNYLQAALWRKVEGAKEVVPPVSEAAGTVSNGTQSNGTESNRTFFKPSSAHKRRRLSLSSDSERTAASTNPPSTTEPAITQNSSTSGSPGHNTSSHMEIAESQDLTLPHRPQREVAQLGGDLAKLRTDLLSLTNGMNVRNLEVLYHVLEGEIDALEMETDRKVVLQVGYGVQL